MGKFRGIVVIPAELLAGDHAPFLVELLEPHQTVEGVGPKCGCADLAATSDARDAATNRFGNHRKRHASFVASYPQYRDTPYKGWDNLAHPDAAYRAAVTEHEAPYLEFLTRQIAENLANAKPQPGCRGCNGTGRVAGEEARDGLFTSFSPLETGRVIDVLQGEPPFAIFLPDGAAAVSDLPDTWQSHGTTWPAAARHMLAPHAAEQMLWVSFSC